MSKSPVERTLEWLRANKMKYDIASSFNTYSNSRKDLFGIIDVVAFKNYYFSRATFKGIERKFFKTVIIGIQVCGQDWQPHMRKIKASPFALDWVLAGELWLIGWRELKSGWKSRTYKFERGDFQKVPSNPLKVSSTPDISAL